MSAFSKEFEKRLSRELQIRSPDSLASDLRWRRLFRRWFGNLLTRIIHFVYLIGSVLFFGAFLIGSGDEFRVHNAALSLILWIAIRGVMLANSLLTEFKFSARSRTLLALPCPESTVITATLRNLRRRPVLIWMEFAVMIALGIFARNADSDLPFPVLLWLTTATAGLFGVLGVASWLIFLSGFFQWKLPASFVFDNKALHPLFGWLLVAALVFARPLADPLAESLEGFYAHLHWIPLLGGPVRCFDPLPGQPGPAAFLAITIAAALFPLVFAGVGLKRGTDFLRRYANALLATHWRSGETAPPAVRSRKKPPPPATVSPVESLQPHAAKPEPSAARFGFIESFATQWLTGDQRRAMIVHLGSRYPDWTRRTLIGYLVLLSLIPLCALLRPLGISPVSIGLGSIGFGLGLLCFFRMIGGAMPSRGMNLTALGSFQAPLFAGWPIRIIDLLRADWKITVIRNVAALPVATAAAFGIGWNLGQDFQWGATAALNVFVFLIFMSIARPLSLISQLANATKRPGFFNSVFWIQTAIGIPLVLTTVLLLGGGFLMLNLEDPFFRFSGILSIALVALPVLGLVWLHQALYNHVRISLETIPSDLPRPK